MTVQEMKNINIGDVVEDLELLKNTKKEKYCVVTKIYDNGIIVIAYKKEDEGHYPHFFNFNDYDSVKLGRIKFNIFDKMREKNINSIESLLEKASKI